MTSAGCLCPKPLEERPISHDLTTVGACLYWQKCSSLLVKYLIQLSCTLAKTWMTSAGCRVKMNVRFCPYSTSNGLDAITCLHVRPQTVRPNWDHVQQTNINCCLVIMYRITEFRWENLTTIAAHSTWHSWPNGHESLKRSFLQLASSQVEEQQTREKWKQH